MMNLKYLSLLVLVLGFTGCATHTVPATHVANATHFQKSLLHMPRVVFIGDSLTYAWITQETASHPLWINAASDTPETTSSMVGRFSHDVLNQHPDIVVIWAGSFEAEAWSQPLQYGDVGSNVAQMAQTATDAHIKVILCSLPALGAPGNSTLVSTYNRDQRNAVMLSGTAPYDTYGYADLAPVRDSVQNLTESVEVVIESFHVGGIR